MARDRYAYVENNPTRWVDPSGHYKAESEAYYPKKPKTTPTSTPTPTSTVTPTATTTPTPTTAPTSAGPACSESNWSVVCSDPTLLSSGQVQTNIVYPIHQTPENYDGPFVDEGCVGLSCLVILIADAAHYLQYQTDLPARFITGNYAVATVNYEVHHNSVGYYTTLTSLEVLNKTDASISLERVTINNRQYELEIPILIEQGRSIINISTPRIPGESVSASFYFRSQVYNIFVLNAAN